MTTPANDTPATPVKLRQDIRELKSWEDVDVALGILRLTEARVSTITASHDTRIQAIQEEKQKALQSHLDKTERIAALLEAFVRRNRATLGKIKKGQLPKSRKFVHGVAGFKLGNPKLVFGTSEDITKKLLRARGHTACFVIREDLVKGEVKKLPAAEHRLCGVEIRQDEEFFYKLNSDAPVQYPDVAEEDE